MEKGWQSGGLFDIDYDAWLADARTGTVEEQDLHAIAIAAGDGARERNRI
jgi:hypothetical protein